MPWSHDQTIDQIFENIKFMGRHIFQEPTYNTFGEKAYREYQIGGAKAEAELGYPTVSECYEQLLQGSLSPEALHMA
jgi:triphosphoribosyl-dephospho-CoA synthetase